MPHNMRFSRAVLGLTVFLVTLVLLTHVTFLDRLNAQKSEPFEWVLGPPLQLRESLTHSPPPFFPPDDPRHQAYPYKCHAKGLSEGIDVVYMWVNGTDPWYHQQLEFWRSRTPMDVQVISDVASNSRFRDNDELRYSFRSTAKYLRGWIRYIHLLVNGDQVPTWFNRSQEGVFIVPHRVVFENPAKHLPTFNTYAIKVNLHRIPNLADRFIIVDDDMFFTSTKASTPALYINPHTKAHYIYLQRRIVHNHTDPNPVPIEKLLKRPFINSEWRAINISNHLLHHRYGSWDRFYASHVPTLIDRSLLHYLAEEFRDEFATTTAHRFRNNDIHMQFLHCNFWALVAQTKRRLPLSFHSLFRQQYDWDGDGILNDCELEVLIDRVRSLPRVCAMGKMALPAHIDSETLSNELEEFSRKDRRSANALMEFSALSEAIALRHKCLEARWHLSERIAPEMMFLKLDDPKEAAHNFMKLRKSPPPLLCMNDNMSDKNYRETVGLMTNWLRTTFPEPSPWEKV